MASMFAGASNVSITGGTFNIINNDERYLMSNIALKDLGKAASQNALHDSAARYDPPKCHPNTRTAVLDMIEEFVQGSGEMQSSLLWLYGGAGAGKSAIVQSVAERCIPQGLVLGCFFFSRTDPSRNSAMGLIPTLAYQLARAFPAMMAVIEGIITSDPLIFSSSPKRQAYELLVRPLQHLASHGIIANGPSSPRAFLIDGLDECNDPKMQTAVINVVIELLVKYSLPVVFLIASRPEQHIVAAFSAQSFPYGSIPLSDHTDSEADIRRYIADAFKHISLQHPFKDQIPASWPPPSSVDELVHKSSSHFIYAATAMKYVMSPHDSPLHSLQVILGLQAPRNAKRMPFSDLDALYHHIFSSATYPKESLAILAQCLLADALNDSVDEIAFVLGYEPSDIYIFIADLQALVTTVKNGDLVRVNLRHASLGDFLLDKSRAREMHVDHHAYHARYVARYFQLFDLVAQTGSHEHVIYREIVTSGRIAYGIDRLLNAVEHSMRWVKTTSDIVQLFWQHNPRDIWNFCTSLYSNLELVTGSLMRYMNLIEDAEFQDDGRLYHHHMAVYIPIVHAFMHSWGSFSQIALPLIFSGFSVRSMRKLLAAYFNDYICYHLIGHLYHKRGSAIATHRMKLASAIYGQITPAVRLADVARTLLNTLSSSYQYLVTANRSPHEKWLRRTKPSKLIALGNPRLARRFRTLKLALFLSQPFQPCFTAQALKLSVRSCRMIWNAHRWYPLLLQAVARTLPLADPSDELAKLTRKMLPRGAHQFSVTMRRARHAMDIYTERVEHTKLALLTD